MQSKDACQEHTTDNMAAPAQYVEEDGTELMAEPLMGGGAPADDSAPTMDQRDEAEDGGENFVWRPSAYRKKPPKATAGQAGKAKRVSEEAARKATAGQAGKAKRVSEEAARKAAAG
jgi:hypothetical protein